jgi:hypothetical protein
MKTRVWCCLVALSTICCNQETDRGPLTVAAAAVGDPENGFPNPAERALFMAANRTRSDPATVKGPMSKIYAASAPLMVAYDLERSSRFHAVMLSRGHAPLMHDSPCTLKADAASSGCDGTPACGCTTGATNCGSSCSVACTAGTGPFARIAMFYPGNHGALGEIIAAGYGNPWATMDAWVGEPEGADGHRAIVTSASYGVAGFGHASDSGACYGNFEGGDFAGDKPAVALIPSAAPKPIAGSANSTFRIYATWADKSGGAPAALRAVVDGSCRDLTRELGDPKLNSTWYADVQLPAGCHSVYILGTSAAGQRAVYPQTTAFTINVGNSAACADSVAQVAASCDLGGQDAGAVDASIPADLSLVRDLATPADLTTPADLASTDLATGGGSTTPSALLTAPQNGDVIARSSRQTIRASAAAAAGRTINSVVLHWTRGTTTQDYNLAAGSPAGSYAVTLVMPASAGPRSLAVTATDSSGQSATTAPITITVQ